MSFPSPTPPASLGTYARGVLDYLAGYEAASDIVIGGGIALAHYLDYRDTFDLRRDARGGVVSRPHRVFAGQRCLQDDRLGGAGSASRPA